MQNQVLIKQETLLFKDLVDHSTIISLMKISDWLGLRKIELKGFLKLNSFSPLILEKKLLEEKNHFMILV